MKLLCTERSCATVRGFEGADCWLQHDSATCHTSNETTNKLRDLRGDCLSSINIWLLCSPDLSRPEFFFFLWGLLKERTRKDTPPPQTLNDLKMAISQAISDVIPTVLTIWRSRKELCLQESGGHLHNWHEPYQYRPTICT